MSLVVRQNTKNDLSLSKNSLIESLRILSEKKGTVVKTAGVSDTIAANELVGAKTILQDSAGADINLTFPNADDLVASLKITETNQSVQFYVRNTSTSNGTITFQPGTNLTLSPAGLSIGEGEMAIVQIFFSSVTSGSEAGIAYVFVGSSAAGGGVVGLSLLNECVNNAQLAAESPATTILSTSGAGDLQTAISAASDGDIIEIQTNATYSVITIPASTILTIRAAYGYHPIVQGDRACRLSNGASHVTFVGITFDACTNTGNLNYEGTCVTFAEHETIVNNILFYQCQFTNVGSGSAVMLSYHWSVSGDNYANPPQPDELSDKICFVDCHAFHACTDGTEGAAFVLRGVKRAVFYRCDIDGDAPNVTDSRGILLQNCPQSIISHCDIHRIGDGGGNNEAIKMDVTGSPTAVFPSGVVQYNTVQSATEGIDIDDDVVGAIVYGNRVRDCTDEGISVDNDATALLLNNKTYNCGTGIRVDAGAEWALYNNASFFNTTNYNTPAAVDASNLEYYAQEEESHGTFDLGATGAITTTVADGLRYSKIGPNVTLTFSPITDGTAGAATISLNADGSPLPVELRPAFTQHKILQVVDNLTPAIGIVGFFTNGTITVYNTINATVFSGGNLTGLDLGFSITYTVAP